ncbi:RsmB/NOP family class I SAM-dependent RNA methyltransferase [Stakelama saccharophila]|uniref:RsmB/NOP family class I SAM-dependent RNA methyltransferase n=1 Tax=Stakelama saccharophila TaxID=3075605 RepID=A0ABZ0B555_9SPHN|nr:RsmB/NOP family class I SAM-dependent RNA methyltransferase [Stakelama sp. W311]WNO52499.1 RsmB/NOP family class I SAM-dependent RNA methyltransferase [Stakelama sp. W311]
MTPSARTQAAIEVLDRIIEAARDQGAAADTILQRYFGERRYAGSKDRKAIRAVVYDAIRLLGDRPESGRTAMLALARRRPDLIEHFGAGRYGPSSIAGEEVPATEGYAPEWLVDELDRSGIDAFERNALLARAPLDLRVNPLRAKIEDVAEALPDTSPIDAVPMGLRVHEELTVDRLPLYRNGAFEIQDAGSQIVSLAPGAAPGMTVVDLCAGAGGKTLAMAALMADRGRILACDTVKRRLERLAPRAERAGVSIVETRLLDSDGEREQLADLEGQADIVLVDAPCSGTGTWRRNPESRWRLTPKRLDRLVAQQAELLDIGSQLVRPGGALVHIVCSVLDREGVDQVSQFLDRHPGWRAEPLSLPAGDAHGGGVRLTPARHSTDGFFVAKLSRPC